jgi:hypothetical protein
MTVSVAAAKAVLEAQLIDNPNADLRLTCARCGRESVYTRQMVLELMPPDLQDLALAPSEFWAFIMIAGPTVKSTRQHAFVGEPVLLRRIEQTTDGWRATLLTPSKFAPSLKVGEELIGLRDGDFDVCSHVVRGAEFKKIPLADSMPNQSEFALFFLPDQPGAHFLTATLFCANQSCYYPFQVTYSEWAARSARLRGATQPHSGVREFITIECPQCGTHRTVTEQSFDGMVKV